MTIITLPPEPPTQPPTARRITCPHCNGEFYNITCPQCNGTGKILVIPCYACSSEREPARQTCQVCNAQGILRLIPSNYGISGNPTAWTDAPLFATTPPEPPTQPTHNERIFHHCRHCLTDWTEDELYKALDNNEDYLVEVLSTGHCPECYESELY